MKHFAALCLLLGHAMAGACAPGKGLIVHEWGVFRVNEDADFANADLRAVWDDLPAFAYGHIKGRLVPQHWGAYEIRKDPVIYFHAVEPTTVRMRIDFPGGMAGVWFPATEFPAIFMGERQPKIGNRLEWNLAIKECPQGWLPQAQAPPDVAGKHWLHLRQVKADEVFARFSRNRTDVEREKFVYYDGIFPHGKWMKIRIDKDAVSLTSLVKHPVFDATIVDRRAEKIRIGRIPRIEAGETVKSVAFTEVDTLRFVAEASDILVKQLVAAGLHDDEAKSLLFVWKKDMFETPGLNLFYRLPQEQYDARLPMTLTTEAESVVRVGLIYHGHLEPDFAERILELVKQFDSDKFGERDAAMKKLLTIGPAALAQMQRFRNRNELSVEVRERIDRLVKKWSSKQAFDD
jgi:hypothetical protein